MLLAPLLAAASEPIPWQRVPVTADEAAAAWLLVEDRSVTCPARVVVDVMGEVSAVWTLGCRPVLARRVEEALARWRFMPATRGARAVEAELLLDVRFEVGMVVTVDPADDPLLVQVPPAAVPLWPRPPGRTRWGREWVREHAGQATRCRLDMAVNRRGGPADVHVVDCPAELAESVLRYGRRWGFRVVGARPGDGRHYRLDLYFAAGPRPDGSPGIDPVSELHSDGGPP